MRIYLAARYSRREELCGYRTKIASLGHVVTSRWLDGQHQVSDAGIPIGDKGESLVEGDSGSTSAAAAEMRDRFAWEDFLDVTGSDLLIAFTEPARQTHSRGGRHVELGIALGCYHRVWVVGHRENIFCWLQAVRFFEKWEEAYLALSENKE